MSDPFRMYEAARKHMYTAMERESSDHPAARRGFEQALAGFSEFMAAAAKNRGMYRELVLPSQPHMASSRVLSAFDARDLTPCTRRAAMCDCLSLTTLLCLHVLLAGEEGNQDEGDLPAEAAGPRRCCGAEGTESTDAAGIE